MIRVLPHVRDSSALLSAPRVVLSLASGARESFEVEAVLGGARETRLKLLGVDDRDRAQALRGARISVERELLEKPREGEAYLVDLVGAEVMAPDGVVGRVTEVLVNPSVDSVVIAAADGRILEQALIPDFVALIDPDRSRIELLSRDGLIEQGASRIPP